MPRKVRVIPANTNEPMKHVVIYARVSSNTMDQLESLKTQVSGLTKFIGYISKMVNSRNRINEKVIFLHVSNTEEICDLMHSFLD